MCLFVLPSHEKALLKPGTVPRPGPGNEQHVWLQECGVPSPWRSNLVGGERLVDVGTAHLNSALLRICVETMFMIFQSHM